ncbi:hypothetical protein FRC10_001055 [Ceratobasidium sp. 414]|nr:hypothetical protein FRC10_001055 [Ceratobasidium sp. 414]
MRTPTTLFALLAFTSFVAGRMATPHRRATDTCANVDLRVNIPLASVDVQVCACLGQLDAVISGNSVISTTLGTMGGLANVKAIITTALNASNSTTNASAVPENTTATANAPPNSAPLSARPFPSRRAPHVYTCATSTGEISAAGTMVRPTGHDVR